MKLKPDSAFFATAIALLTLWFGFIAPAVADGNQSNQGMHRSAQITAPEPSFQVNVYPKPDQSKQRVGYGSSGDQITVLEQVSSNEGETWNHVQFSDSPNLEGWVQEKYISFQTRSVNSFDQYYQSSNQSGNYKNAPQHYQGNQSNQRND